MQSVSILRRLKQMARREGIKIQYGALQALYNTADDSILVQKGMSEEMQIESIAHELGHALQWRKNQDLSEEGADQKAAEIMEELNG
jgi:antirestriction protein ArdC